MPRPTTATSPPRSRGLATSLVITAALALAGPAHAWMIAPDNGSGTVALPPIGAYLSDPSSPLAIIDGLPAGTTIEIDARLHSTGGIEAAGGSLGGHHQSWNPAVLDLDLSGTGLLAGYSRSVSMTGVFVSTYSAPRAPGTSPQSFAQDLFMLQGQLPPGDPDFDLLRITAGTGNGLPSPGHTTLTDAGAGSWLVDSFFDVTWRIDFIAAPGSAIDDVYYWTPSGSTTGTTRFTLGPIPEPSTGVLLALGLSGLAAFRRRSG